MLIVREAIGFWVLGKSLTDGGRKKGGQLAGLIGPSVLLSPMVWSKVCLLACLNCLLLAWDFDQ
jgi:hypothetical protein